MDVSGKSVSLVLIDGNGKEIDYSDNEHITMSAVMVIAGADILKCQTIPIQMAASGSVADGYQYTGLEMSLNSVTLKGYYVRLHVNSSAIHRRGIGFNRVGRG